jgi:hypothetical protein
MALIFVYISLNMGFIKLKKYKFIVGDAYLDELCVMQARPTYFCFVSEI